MHKDQTCESTELNRQFHATQIMKSFCTFRFPMPGDETAYIVCVADNPRIHYCGDNSLFDPQTLSCLNYQVISQCHSVLIAMPMSTYFVLIAARAPDRPPRPSSPLPVQPIRQIIGDQLDPSYLFISTYLFNHCHCFCWTPNKTFVLLLFSSQIWFPLFYFRFLPPGKLVDIDCPEIKHNQDHPCIVNKRYN